MSELTSRFEIEQESVEQRLDDNDLGSDRARSSGLLSAM